MKLFTPCAVVLAALLLTGCGKTKPAAEAADGTTQTSLSADAADGQPATEDGSGTAQQADEPAGNPDNGRTEAAPEAKATTWVCTWCHEEYTGTSQPTSFQPGKCERNPGKAHAWHKQ